MAGHIKQVLNHREEDQWGSSAQAPVFQCVLICTKMTFEGAATYTQTVSILASLSLCTECTISIGIHKHTFIFGFGPFVCIMRSEWLLFFYSWSSVTIWCSTDVWMYPSGAYWNSRQTLYELCSEEFSQSGLRGWQREVWGKKTHTLQCRQVKRCYWRYILYIMRSLH